METGGFVGEGKEEYGNEVCKGVPLVGGRVTRYGGQEVPDRGASRVKVCCPGGTRI